MNGVNKVVHYLATQQVRLGHDVSVWALGATKSNSSGLHRDYTLQRFARTPARFLLPPMLKNAINGLQNNTWVQFHSVFVPEFWSIARRLSRAGIPYGLTPHGGYALQGLKSGWMKKRLYLSLVERSVLSNARLIHAIGASEVGDIHRLRPSAHVVLVPNGQELAGLNTVESISVAAERPIFTYCGRLAANHKGLDLLVTGFGRFKKGGGKGTLWLIGDGTDRDALEELSERLGIAHYTEFFGPRFGAEKLKLLTASDAFVHPSRWDVMPTSCLEAAAVGLPLVISRETNLGNAVEESCAGTVLFENSESGVANALVSCEAKWFSGALQDEGVAARHMVRDKFGWPQIAATLVEQYQRSADLRSERVGS